MTTLDCWKEYADTYCQVARALIDRGECPPAPPFIQSLIGIPVSKKKNISPPKIDRLGWALPQMPPIICRKDVGHWIGLTPSTLANSDAQGTGPRVRYIIGRRVFYPTAYLLEWLEEQGLEVKTVACRGDS